MELKFKIDNIPMKKIYDWISHYCFDKGNSNIIIMINRVSYGDVHDSKFNITGHYTVKDKEVLGE